ncbi:MAG: methionyl-tRNA formyltransferase [Alphaproteobacteria bacterium]|nr:methionyl-tRNA formyltransferase [Alphaproteobacteria bacterium]
MAQKLRLAFMGTPEFSVVALRALAQVGHDIAAVYCQPPKPAGRGHQLQKSAVQIAAEEMGLEVHTPKTLRDAEEQKKFAALRLDAAVVVAYGLILPKAILDAPKFGCINIHASLLPRWRGAAPIQRALLSGDAETGITIMQMAEGLDTGPMLLIEKMPITLHSTSGTLHDDLSRMGAKMIVQTLSDVASGKAKPIPQSESGVTYAAKLTREDGRIDWNKPAAEIERQIRALQPWPSCFFMLNGEPVKLLSAEIIKGKAAAPGTLLDEDFTVACGTDVLHLLTVQRAGKPPTDGASFLRGARLAAGHKL